MPPAPPRPDGAAARLIGEPRPSGGLRWRRAGRGRPARNVTVFTALLLAGLLLAPHAGAEAPAQPVSTAEPEKEPEPAPISLGLVGVRAAELQARLRELRVELADTDVVDTIAEDLASSQQQLAEQEAELEARLAGSYVESDVNSLRVRWQAASGALAVQEKKLAARARQLEDAAEEIAFQHESWRLTRRSPGDGPARETVLKEVGGSLEILSKAEDVLDEARAGVLTVQEGLRVARNRVDNALERLTAAAAGLRGQLFVQQGPPIWAIGLPQTSAENVEALRLRLAHARSDMRSYVQLRGPRFVEQGLLVVLALLLVQRMRRRAGDELDPHDVLVHPVAAGLLLGLALGTRLHPDAPIAMRMIQTLAILAPWLVLTRGVLPAWLGRPVLGLTVLLVVRLAYRFFTDLSWLTNLLLIAILAGGFAGTLWLTRPQRLEALPALARGPWLRLLGLWVRTLVLLFGAGLLAALFGYRALAEQLSYVGLWGSFLAIVMLGMVRIIERLLEVAVRTGALDGLELIRGAPDRALATAKRILRVGGLLAWVWITLHDASLAEPIAESLGPWLGMELGYGNFTFSVGGVLAFGITLWLFWWASRLLAAVVEHEVFSRVEAEPGVAYAVASFSRYALLVVGFVAAIAMMGVPLQNVTLLVSALGVGIGFGLQTVVNNFVSGVILLVERPVRVGDQVQIADLMGTVREIGIRASRVRTYDGSDVIVPNSEFVSAQVTNWTLSDRKRRITLPIGVAYGTPPEQVIEILLQVAREHPEVLADPEPVALFRGFGDSSLDFELRAFTESLRGWLAVNSDMAVAVNTALAEAGIEIPFPQRDLHLRSVDPTVRGGGDAHEVPAPDLRDPQGSPPGDPEGQPKGDPEADPKDTRYPKATR